MADSGQLHVVTGAFGFSGKYTPAACWTRGIGWRP